MLRFLIRRPRHSPSWLSPLLIAAACAAASSCGEEPPPPPPGGTDVPVSPIWGCRDADGDEYGYGCSMGLDCNDNDASVTNECLCSQPGNPGCSCTEAGARAACGTVYSRVGETVVCGQGISTCDGSEWGECIINNAVTLSSVPPQSSTAELRPLALGSASPCGTNPCDPTCTSFQDTGSDLTLDGTSTVVTSPQGLTLPSSEGIYVPGTTSNGFDCTDADYPASTGACAHHPCITGTALDQYCDGSSPTTAPLTIFSDSFSNGNTLGWTTDSNWAIGTTSSSTGHTTGNSDPSSDATTDTTDNRIAGTVLGGTIGGGTAVFTESFSNLSAWTETGEGDWVTQSRDSSTGYTVISGNPVAHSDNCDTSCTITKAINLSAYSSAALNFQYYLSNNMESGEYLRAELSTNGTTWTTVLNKSTTSDQDSTWHTASISLAGYLTSGFRMRFVTNQSYDDEAVEVDDVSITVPAASVTQYLTSPAFNTSASVGNVTLSFKRWLNVNSDFVGKVEVYNGSSWVTLYTSSGAVSDSSWQTVSYDITAYKSASTRVRFSYTGSSLAKVSGWNIDDVTVTGTQAVAGTSLCVGQICAARPECCTTSWSIECVDMLESVCQLECAVDSTAGNACVACFNDPTLTTDVDGDGQSPATGDCRECDPSVSAGAYDLPGDGIDQNCDEVVDNEVTTCDSSLAATGDAWAHAQALGLCKVATGNSWGVVSASFVRSNGSTACTDALQYHIKSSFGAANVPIEGSKMSVFSSGTARTPSETGYVKPDGNGYNAGTSSTPKYSVPAASGCSSGTSGYDSCGLKLVLRAPTNANSFAYNFNFFTSEYPEWLCTKYNDAYVAYYEGSLNTETNKNISFDSASNPVSVNNGLFGIPGIWPPPTLGTNTYLDGTGFDGVCANNPGGTWTSSSICGGSTGWLTTTAPVKPGEEITLIFNVWDTGDNKWDSTVLLDNFTWSTETASIGTGHYVPSTPPTVTPPTYSEGWFTRDYDMSNGCDAAFVPAWSLWSWEASTPSDSKIEFYVQTATTKAGLDTAPRDTLLFTDPPGPSSLANTAAIARAGSPDTQAGSATVQDALEAAGRPLNQPFLRISARLMPSSDKLTAPVLESWNLQTSCQTAQ